MIGTTNVVSKKQENVERINISLLTNQASHNDVLGATFTVSYENFSKTYTWDGFAVTITIPAHVTYTVSFSGVTGYKKPSNVTYTATTGNSRTLNATYQTCVLSVLIADNQTSLNDIANVKATVKGTTVNTTLSSGGTVKVPFGEAVTITGAALTGYATPNAVSYTAAEASKTVTLTYNTTLVTVAMADNQSAYDDIANATATVAASGISTQTVSNGGVVKVPTGVSCTVTWNAISNYSTPSAQTFTTSGSAVTKTGTYQCQVLAVNVVGSGATPSGYTITVKNSSTGATIGTQTTASGVYKIAWGASYTVSASAVSGYNAVADQSGTANTDSKTITMTYVYNPTIDLSKRDIYGNTIAQTTANCYVVKETGQYKIPLVFGNALKNGSTNSAAYTKNSGSYSHDFVDYNGTVITSPYIETVSGAASSAQLSIADADGVFSDFSIIDGSPCRYLQFKVNSVPATGANGVLSIKNSSGVIMWSWHIWVWADSLATVEITNSTSVKYKILPVNLASKWDDTAKTKIKNWFYQFGRPNPMLCPSSYNSTSNHASYGALSFAATSIASNIQTGIQNPTTFYKYSLSYNYNWFKTNSGKTYNLWDAACTSTGNSDNNVVKTIYDPSPIGFKMPNGNTFTGFSIINNANGIVKFTRYSGDSTGIGFPVSGSRLSSDGSLSRVGSSGYVWLSSANSQNYAYGLYFHSGYVDPQNYSSRANGFGVRPVQE